MSRRFVQAMVAVVASVCLAGCGLTLNDVPLPAIVSGPTYPLNAQFTDALGLPEQAAVKLDGATVGEVETIHADGYTAQVGMVIRQDVQLPAGTRAEIQYSSPMGEAFVALMPPSDPSGVLPSGSTIPISRTDAAPSATDLLATLSTVVSGGTFDDLNTIVTQLKIALGGNTGTVRSLIGRLDSMLGGLNAHTVAFTESLDQMDRVSKELASDRGLIGTAIHTLEPTIRTLSEQTNQALALMAQLRRLSASGQATIASGRASMVGVVDDLGPILETLTRNAAAFPQIFDGIKAFGANSASAGWGLYANFDLTSIFQPGSILPKGLP